jgi:PAS domain S-box-containing protein
MMKGTDHPDPNATGALTPLPNMLPGALGRETHERDAALGHSDRRVAAAESAPGESADALFALSGYQVFTALADNVRDYAVFLMDADGIIRYWGEGARLMKWWTRAQIEGMHLRALYMDGGSEDGTAENHLQIAAGAGEYTGEGQRVRQDGSTFWAGITLTALKDAHGKLLGFVKVTRDFTARRAVEAALRAGRKAVEEQRLAEEANRLKTMFIAGVSNEIRAPLVAMTRVLKELERQNEHTQIHVARLVATGRKLTQVVEEIMDISQLEAGWLGVTSTKAQLGEAVKRALSDAQRHAAARTVRIVNSVSGTASETFYWGDPVRVQQIIAHLLSNAIKFSPTAAQVTISGGTIEQPKETQLHLVGPGPWVYVRVEDCGPGIPLDLQQTLFEAFQERRLVAREASDALGLAVSRRLARLMGGDLTVQSHMGSGSTFVLLLPVAESGPEPR